MYSPPIERRTSDKLTTPDKVFLAYSIVVILGITAAGGVEGASTPSPRPVAIILGSGTPEANPERSGPGVAIVVGDSAYLIDAGPGIVRQAVAAVRNGLPQLGPQNLTRLFVTHLHSDHTSGLADLMLNPWVRGRSKTLKIWGPSGITQMTDHLMAAYAEDVRQRLEGLEPANQSGFRLSATQISEGEVYRDEQVTVEAFAVDHGSWPAAFGFKFRTPTKTFVISGDTAPSESLIKAARGCDILIHEVYSVAHLESQSAEWQEYFARFHTSTLQLAKIASTAKPKLLVLYHQFFWGASDTQLVQEIKDFYSGEVVSAHDLDVFE